MALSAIRLICLKPWLMGLLLACALMAAQAWAQTVTFDVTGTVKQSACTPNIQRQLVPGSSNTANAVTLPNADVTDHLYAANKTHGNVTLQFRAYGCTGYVNNMWVYFTSANVDPNGRIIPNNSNQVRFEIRNNNVNGTLIKVGSNGSSTGSQPSTSTQGTAVSFSGSHPGSGSGRQADKYYGIRWYAQTAVTQTGYYSAQVTANFKYY